MSPTVSRPSRSSLLVGGLGGVILVALGGLAAVELAVTWEAVLQASTSSDTRSVGEGWRTGDGMAVSRGRWLTLMTGHTLLWGVPLSVAAIYGLGVASHATRVLYGDRLRTDPQP